MKKKKNDDCNDGGGAECWNNKQEPLIMVVERVVRKSATD